MKVKKTMLMAVACRNAMGEPDMPVFRIEVTEEEIKNGDHYDKATEKAGENGYEGPFLAYDRGDVRALRAAVQTLRLVPTKVMVNMNGGAIHDVSCDFGSIDVLLFDTEDEGADNRKLLPVGFDGEDQMSWFSIWAAKATQQVVRVFAAAREKPRRRRKS